MRISEKTRSEMMLVAAALVLVIRVARCSIESAQHFVLYAAVLVREILWNDDGETMRPYDHMVILVVMGTSMYSWGVWGARSFSGEESSSGVNQWRKCFDIWSAICGVYSHNRP